MCEEGLSSSCAQLKEYQEIFFYFIEHGTMVQRSKEKLAGT
jgi:hypothetical protein